MDGLDVLQKYSPYPKPNMNKASSSTPTAGKCLCGSITYFFAAEPIWPHYCCCDDCQRWSGAPTVAWVDFPQSSFSLNDPNGWLKIYRSSSASQRAFCSQCGSSLFAIDDDGKNMSVTIVTLDRPNLHRPETVSYVTFAPRWLPIKALKEQ